MKPGDTVYYHASHMCTSQSNMVKATVLRTKNEELIVIVENYDEVYKDSVNINNVVNHPEDYEGLRLRLYKAYLKKKIKSQKEYLAKIQKESDVLIKEYESVLKVMNG